MSWLIQLECVGCYISYSNQHEQMNWLKISMSIKQLIIFRLKCMPYLPGFSVIAHQMILWLALSSRFMWTWMVSLWAKLQPTSFKRFSAVWNSFQQSGKRKKFSRAGLSSMCCMINFSLAKSNKNDLPVEVLHSY